MSSAKKVVVKATVKKKAAPTKPVKKAPPVKKPVKKAAPAKPVKKAAPAKSTPAKKPVKKAATKPVKKAATAKPVKKTAAKPVKKAAPAKPVKKTAAKPVKKAAPAKPVKKTAAKPVKKAAPVKPVVKAAPAKPAPKAVPKVAPPVVAEEPHRLVMLPSARPTKKRSGPQLKPLRNIPIPLVVSAGDEPWTKAELNAIKRDLQTDLDRLRLELASAEVEIADLLKDSGDGAGDDQADAGTKTFEREHELSLVNNARDMVLQSERALARIEIGTYGVCESCGNPIGKARLQVFPRATLCMVCKQREERR